MLNKSTGNMFDWVTHTWNPIKGKCSHGCHYCYMKRWGEQKPVRLVESEFKTDLGSGNTIFVGSSCDIFADDIPYDWIMKSLAYCNEFDNKYLFQTKNPKRMSNFRNYIPSNSILGTTIESDLWHDEMGNAPTPSNRSSWIYDLFCHGFKTTVTVEPIMSFNLKRFINMITGCEPAWVSIGANTNHKIKLIEPKKDALEVFIESIRNISEVKIKSNLKRLMK